ncbi:hypothetical protein ACLKA6_009365 [Drosophila palustris]
MQCAVLHQVFIARAEGSSSSFLIQYVKSVVMNLQHLHEGVKKRLLPDGSYDRRSQQLPVRVGALGFCVFWVAG